MRRTRYADQGGNQSRNVAVRTGTIRLVRRIHRLTASFLSVTLLIVAVTGILLGWKKNSNGYLHPDSHQGTTTDIARWLPLDSLRTIAIMRLHETAGEELSEELDRIDIRPDYGMVKFVFAHHYHGIQLDAATGELLHRERRRSDVIEDIHDMSLADKLLGFESEIIKLIYTSFVGLSLILFTITGVWLRYFTGQRKRGR